MEGATGWRYGQTLVSWENKHYLRVSKYGKLCLLMQYFGKCLAKLFVAYSHVKDKNFDMKLKTKFVW